MDPIEIESVEFGWFLKPLELVLQILVRSQITRSRVALEVFCTGGSTTQSP